MNARMLRATLGALIATVALSACGGDDSPSPSSDNGGTTSTAAAAAAAPTKSAVLACLQSAGLQAEDQSSNTSGDTIGIDYSGGRTVISFEASESDAETSEGVAASQGGGAFRAGTIVVSLADDPAAAADRPKIDACVQA
jgi:hypothetical protein